MLRKTLVTVALTAGMVAGTTGVASAHECFVAKRSDKGNAGAAHSANWYTLELAELYAHAHLFLSENQEDPELPALTPEQVQQAIDLVSAQGVPTSFTLFEKHMLPRSVEQLEALAGPAAADGKGIDHFFVAYGDQIVGGYFAVAFPA